MQVGLTRISLSNAPQAGTGAVAYYGNFYDNTRQAVVTPLSTQFVNIGNTFLSNGVTIGSGTDIIFANAGVYSVQFRLQIENLSPQEHTAYYYLNYMGVALANTSTVLTIPRQHTGGSGWVTAIGQYTLNVNAGDNVQIVWTADNGNVRIEPLASPTPPVPQSAAVVVNVSKI